MGKRVLLVDQIGNQSLSIDEDDFDEHPERNLLDQTKTYAQLGFKIARYEDGTAYKGKAAAKPADVASADNPRPQDDEEPKAKR
jgi:hypothetical protein